MKTLTGHQRTAGTSLVGLTGVLWFALSSAACAAADEEVELVISLDADGRYSLRDFCAECNRALGSKYDLDHLADRRLPITAVERAALAAASATQLLNVRLEANRIVLRLPDRQSDAVRRSNRRRLERLLGVPLPEWPADKGLHLPKGFDPLKRTIVLLHGLDSGPASLRPLSTACERWGIQPVLFDYPNDGPLNWSGDRLSEELRALAAKYPQARVAVVGYSMGGLVARYCLETPGKNPGCVSDVFLLGTPNHGSQLAVAEDWLELVNELSPYLFSTLQTLRDGLGEAADDIGPASRFLTLLNSRARPSNVRYHVAIGRKGFLSAEQQGRIADELDGILQRRQVPADARSRLFRFVRCEELQTNRGDGAVSIGSARLHDAASERIFDVNHLEWVDLPSPRPEESEVFRWIVDQLHWPRQTETKQ